MWNVWPCRRNDLIRKIKLISKFMTLQPTVSDKICGTNTNFINFFSHTPSPSPWTQCWFWKTFFQNLPDFKIEIKGRGVEIVKSVNFFCVPVYFVRDYLNKVLILKNGQSCRCVALTRKGTPGSLRTTFHTVWIFALLFLSLGNYTLNLSHI